MEWSIRSSDADVRPFSGYAPIDGPVVGATDTHLHEGPGRETTDHDSPLIPCADFVDVGECVGRGEYVCAIRVEHIDPHEPPARLIIPVERVVLAEVACDVDLPRGADP